MILSKGTVWSFCISLTKRDKYIRIKEDLKTNCPMPTQILFSKDIRELQESFREIELGRKGLSLTLLQKFLLPVPDFFIIRTSVFKNLMAEISQNVSIGTLDELRREIIENSLPRELQKEIQTSYKRLSGFGKAWVAVRASISCPTHPEITFSGQLDTFLNVRDTSEIELAVKEIYASAFNQQVSDYLKSNSLIYSDISVGIIVQKMIQSEVSGTLYTYDPITLNRNNVSIEAVFGLGDVISDGSINPDTYLVAKQNSEVLEKRVVPQEWMKVRRIGDLSALEHIQKIKISKVWQYSQKLDEGLIKELTSIASRIETIFDPFQIIEWTMEGGRLWVLQIKTVSPKNSEPLSKSLLQQQPKRLKKKKKFKIETAIVEEIPSQEMSETLLFLGNPASSGSAYGKALVISPDIAKQEDLLKNLLKECTKETILIAEEFSTVLEPFFYVVGGIITNFGGINSDAAITARELGLPAIVGTRIATVFIQNGTLLKIDGTSGTVYRVDSLPGHPFQTDISYSERKAQAITDKEYTEQPKAAPVSYSSIVKLFISDKLGKSSHLFMDTEDKFDNSQDYLSVILASTDIDTAFIKKVKKIKHLITGSLYIQITNIPTITAILEEKKKLSLRNIRRTKKTKILLTIDSFYQLLHILQYADSGVDGIILDIDLILRSYKTPDSKIDDELTEFIATQLAQIRNIPLDIIGLKIKSNEINEAFPKYIIHLSQAGCNAIIVTNGTKQLTQQDIISFSTSYNATVLKLPQ